MNLTAPPPSAIGAISAEARRRMCAVRGEPLFIADWQRALFIHFEADPAALQRCVPFELDLRNGRAFVSLVAFTMRGMRPRIGGAFAAWLFRHVATHPFLNVRTYVQHRGEPGIYFLAEWLSNRLSVRLGPPLFGLPYRHGSLVYEDEHERRRLRGCVKASDGVGSLSYRATLATTASPHASAPGSLEEFLLERYSAFTERRGRMRLFHVHHAPWRQVPADVVIEEDSLLDTTGDWSGTKQFVGAHYSHGVTGVWMGRPHRTS